MGLTTSSSHFPSAAFLLRTKTRSLMFGVIEEAVDRDEDKLRFNESKRTRPRRKMGAGLVVSRDGKREANDAKFSGSANEAGAADNV